MRRARRYILRVRPDGRLRVTIPRGGSRAEALEFVARHASWVARERERLTQVQVPVRWTDGCTILLRGEPAPITVVREGEATVARYGGRRVVVMDGENVRAEVERDLRELARERLIPRLHALAERLGLSFTRVTIRNQRSRWGSCSRAGAIALNFRLVQMPDTIADYVLVHELMHLKQQNHGPRFWRLVESACPEFRAGERWLRTHGRTLF